MNLGSGFQIGSSALAAGQSAMNVAGNNMANAATAGYRRQRVGMVPLSGANQLGIGRLGNGVRVSGLTRAIDMALLSRLRHARADEAMLATSQFHLSAIEGLHAATGGGGIAASVEAFLGTWGELANAPTDSAMRGVIVQQGVGLAKQLRDLRTGLVLQRDEIDRSLQDGVNRANALLTSIASLTDQIRAAESSGGAAPSLRDQRDLLVDELATLVDLAVVDRPDGTLDLLVGSTPIMLSGASHGITIVQTGTGLGLATTLDAAPLSVGGALGALVARRSDGVQAEIVRLDRLAESLIHAVNRIHVAGQGLTGRTSATSFLGLDDATIPISQNPLPIAVTAGVIRFQYGPPGTENPSVLEIAVDPGVDSLQQVAAAINAAGGPLAASVDGSNRLVVTAAGGVEFSVLEDQTGLLTAIQFGTFFTGLSAAWIDVADELQADPNLLSVARGDDASAVAVAMSDLAKTSITALGATLGDWWRQGDAALASRIAATSDGADSASIVRLGLESQERAISGVNLDEEAMNLIAAQTQYEAAARYVSALQEALDTLLAMAAR